MISFACHSGGPVRKEGQNLNSGLIGQWKDVHVLTWAAEWKRWEETSFLLTPATLLCPPPQWVSHAHINCPHPPENVALPRSSLPCEP